ncbi:MAG: CPBP family intramembrane metalloprotease [Erysipelotrichaceae bacterium]|nr:CPBP family intramembrane metalloprotease [Erysipelotrichaceae bacterium]
MSKQQAKTLVLLYCGIYLFLFPLIETGLIKLFDPSVIVPVLNVLEWGFYLTFPVIMVSVVWPWFRREFYLFCHHPFKNLIHIIKNYGLMMLSSILVNLILILVFKLEQSGNQSSIIELYSQQPLKVMFAALVFAPIVEELVFRGSFYAPFRKNQRLFGILFSSFLFGFLHVYQSLFAGNFMDLLYIFSYGLLGSFMCRVYDKTNSFFSCVLLHFLNNFISIVLTFLIV